MKILRSIALGTGLASLALCFIGVANTGWLALLSVAVFSVGEMLSSPKFSEYVGSHLAPADKKAMYLGLGQMSFAIGSTIEGIVGPSLYDHFASKDRIARQLLQQDYNWSAENVAAVPQGEAFSKLVEVTGQNADVLTQTLYHSNSVGSIWFIMAAVGFVTAALILGYGAWTARRHRAAEAGQEQNTEQETNRDQQAE